MAMEPGDVVKTYADTKGLEESIGYKPKTSIEDVLGKYGEW